eukprot:s2542_g3.t1
MVDPEKITPAARHDLRTCRILRLKHFPRALNLAQLVTSPKKQLQWDYGSYNGLNLEKHSDQRGPVHAVAAVAGPVVQVPWTLF